MVLTAGWAFAMLDRTPSWNPWLRYCVLVGGLVAVLGILLVPLVGRNVRRAAVVLAVGAALAAPLSFTLDAVATPSTGALPTAGPSGRPVRAPAAPRADSADRPAELGRPAGSPLEVASPAGRRQARSRAAGAAPSPAPDHRPQGASPGPSPGGAEPARLGAGSPGGARPAAS